MFSYKLSLFRSNSPHSNIKIVDKVDLKLNTCFTVLGTGRPEETQLLPPGLACTRRPSPSRKLATGTEGLPAVSWHRLPQGICPAKMQACHQLSIKIALRKKRERSVLLPVVIVIAKVHGGSATVSTNIVSGLPRNNKSSSITSHAHIVVEIPKCTDHSGLPKPCLWQHLLLQEL